MGSNFKIRSMDKLNFYGIIFIQIIFLFSCSADKKAETSQKTKAEINEFVFSSAKRYPDSARLQHALSGVFNILFRFFPII